MSLKIIAFGLVASIAISGCAKKSQDISAQYVSPMQFQSYSCRQITEEAQRVSEYSARAMRVQNQTASTDAVATGVAIVLFWPAAFFVSGNGANADELARLKGQMDALQSASTQKQCGIEFRRAPLPEPT
ncbi:MULTISPECIES: hypothetical protein [unclassified Salipiger]|uniref:hypothetical protein n=1 Tax=unclassified Salipiger TaxID=2640570 RepID=UPI0013BA4B3F|nr:MULTISPECIES: hypothetical protein [unclassified Salipiger]NDV48227.1 hypothetical protein [Salipiger sp. PrR003]NDW35455.1 hypothetical protein [Salipiger sp. PrR007]